MTEKVEGFDKVFDLVGSFGWFQGIILLCMTLQALLSWHHLSAVFLAAVPPHWCEIPELIHSGWTPEEIRNLSVPQSTSSTAQYTWDPCSYYDRNYTEILQTSNGSFDMAYDQISTSLKGANVLQCSHWNWDHSIYKSTVVTDFHLVCHRRVLVGTIQATYMGGVLIGSLVLGSLSDQLLGRRGSVLISLVVSLIGGFASGFATSYEVFLLFRFILAAGVAGGYQNCYVLMLEYSSTSSRAGFGLVGQLSFAFGYMLVALMAYLFRSWSDFQLASTGVGLILVSYFWILPESARWLIYRGDFEEAYKILKKVAKLNGKPEPSRDELFEIFKSCQTAVGEENNLQPKPTNTSAPEMIKCTRKEQWSKVLGNVLEVIKIAMLNYWNLLKTPEIRKRTLLIWSLFIIVDLVYYGVVFDSATLTHDPFLLVFLAGLMEVPAYTVVIPCLTTLGRRPTVVGTFLFTAICSFIVAYTPNQYEIIRVVVSMSGKLFITTCFAVLYLLGAELFPTATRTTGLASAVIMGRLGSIMAPFIVDMVKTTYRDLPNVIFGLVSVVAAIISILLPETRDSEMFDDINALESAANNVKTGDTSNNVDTSDDQFTEIDLKDIELSSYSHSNGHSSTSNKAHADGRRRTS